MRTVAIAAPLAVFAAACTGGDDDGSDDAGDDDVAGPVSRVSLVSDEAWTLVDAAADPLAAHRPGDVECPESAYHPEMVGLGFEIETGLCNYFMAVQPSRAEIAAGETVRVQLAHFDLAAEIEAEAHVAVLIDGEVIWEATEAIPGAAAAFTGEWIADRDLPAGTPVHLHLHNHGYNTWQLYDLSTTE